MEPVLRHGSARRGLATVALLKVNFDAGRDYIAMFEPFVLDAIARGNRDHFSTDELRDAVAERHDLALPTRALATLLARATKRGYVRREGGRYFRLHGHPPALDILAERRAVEERQRLLAAEIRQAAGNEGVELASDDEALGLVLAFLDRHHVSLALEADSVKAQIPDSEAVHDLAEAFIARFIRDSIVERRPIARVIQETLEGYVLQNALLLRDISSATRQFRGLRVYCDSMVLFGALGLRGPAEEAATRQFFELLRTTGASLNVFTTTIREMRRILEVYEYRLATSDGRLSLRASDLTRHFLTNRFTPSDIKEESTLLETRLGTLGFNLRHLPLHRPELTWDEKALADELGARANGDTEQRVTHDVECIAGVLTIRGGRTSDSLDDAQAVFASTSGLTVRCANRWYQKQGGDGMPPMVHYLVLSNFAWLKRPAGFETLKLAELVALCVAALRPTREAWQAFQRHLKKLEVSGTLSSDEVTGILVSRFADAVLLEEDLDDDSDATTVFDAVERIRSEYAEDAERKVVEAIEGARVSIEEAREAARTSVAEAEARAAASEAEARRVRFNVEGRAVFASRAVSWGATGLLMLSVGAGALLSIANAYAGSPPDLWMVLLATGPTTVVELLGLMNGFHVVSVQPWMEQRLTRRFRRWFGGLE